MRCPKCRFVSSDKKDICPSCRIDLRPYKHYLGLPITHPKASLTDLLRQLNDGTTHVEHTPRTPVKSPEPKGGSGTVTPRPIQQTNPAQQKTPAPEIRPAPEISRPVAKPTLPSKHEEPTKRPLSDTIAKLQQSSAPNNLVAKKASSFEEIESAPPIAIRGNFDSKESSDFFAEERTDDSYFEEAANIEDEAQPFRPPTPPARSESELDDLFLKINHAKPPELPSIRPEVMEFQDESEFLQKLDEMIGDTVLNISSVKVDKPAAPKDEPIRNVIVEDDLEISFEFDLETGEEAEEEDRVEDSEGSDGELPSEAAPDTPQLQLPQADDPIIAQSARDEGSLLIGAAPEADSLEDLFAELAAPEVEVDITLDESLDSDSPQTSDGYNFQEGVTIEAAHDISVEEEFAIEEEFEQEEAELMALLEAVSGQDSDTIDAAALTELTSECEVLQTSDQDAQQNSQESEESPPTALDVVRTETAAPESAHHLVQDPEERSIPEHRNEKPAQEDPGKDNDDLFAMPDFVVAGRSSGHNRKEASDYPAPAAEPQISSLRSDQISKAEPSTPDELLKSEEPQKLLSQASEVLPEVDPSGDSAPEMQAKMPVEREEAPEISPRSLEQTADPVSTQFSGGELTPYAELLNLPELPAPAVADQALDQEVIAGAELADTFSATFASDFSAPESDIDQTDPPRTELMSAEDPRVGESSVGDLTAGTGFPDTEALASSAACEADAIYSPTAVDIAQSVLWIGSAHIEAEPIHEAVNSIHPRKVEDLLRAALIEESAPQIVDTQIQREQVLLETEEEGELSSDIPQESGEESELSVSLRDSRAFSADELPAVQHKAFEEQDEKFANDLEAVLQSYKSPSAATPSVLNESELALQDVPISDVSAGKSLDELMAFENDLSIQLDEVDQGLSALLAQTFGPAEHADEVETSTEHTESDETDFEANAETDIDELIRELEIQSLDSHVSDLKSDTDSLSAQPLGFSGATALEGAAHSALDTGGVETSLPASLGNRGQIDSEQNEKDEQDLLWTKAERALEDLIRQPVEYFEFRATDLAPIERSGVLDLLFEVVEREILIPESQIHAPATLPSSVERLVDSTELKAAFTPEAVAQSISAHHVDHRSIGTIAQQSDVIISDEEFFRAPAYLRLAAFMIDILIAALLAVTLSAISFLPREILEALFTPTLPKLLNVLPVLGDLAFITFATFLVLQTALTFGRGMTVGQKTMGLASVSWTGTPPSLSNALIWSILLLLNPVSAGVASLSALGKGGTTLADNIGSVRVVRSLERSSIRSRSQKDEAGPKDN